jgi:arginyl-tRNA synthetase
VITGDLSVATTVALGTAVADGVLPSPRVPAATRVPAWRPVPAEAGGGPGSYATTLPFELARQTGAAPARIAAVLAERLRPREEVSQAGVTGDGYLSVTVSHDTLARLAVRISQAGPGCAASQSLRGTRVGGLPDAQLAATRGWAEAAERLAAEVSGRCATAAGAELSWAEPPTAPLAPAPPGASPVGDAIGYAGEDAVRCALALAAPADPGPGRRGPVIDPHAAAAQHLGNPAYAVRYAHAHAASALRQAADLGLPELDVERFQPRLLAHPSERVLLDAMSWLPERVAGAARRRQPHVVAAYLEDLASRYLDWQEACPVMRPGSVLPRPDPRPAGRLPAGGEVIQARLQLASGARTVLGTGLRLLGIAAPSRM